MNTHELPMIIFTVLAQMSVGAFITLGVINLVASSKYGKDTVARVTDPAIYAIGPTLVLGLIASMFHMNDVFNVFNVFRNLGTSWLSREIVFGLAFAAVGFAFAIMQWFKIGSHTLRQIIAALAAVLGIGLIWSMAKIYTSLETIPAWNTWIVTFHFFATAILLGALAVGTALMANLTLRGTKTHTTSVKKKETVNAGGVTSKVTDRYDDITTTPVDESEYSLAAATVRWIAIVSAIMGSLIMISYIVHITNLATGVPAAQEAAGAFSGDTFIARLLLLAVASIILALFAHKSAKDANHDTKTLTTLMFAALTLATIGELIGRAFHYDSMIPIGM